MTMNSSGPISLGGATAGQSINLENGFSATAQVSLNDTAVRNLAGVASGAITMPTNFYGKANRVSISYTFSANTADAALTLSAISGYSAGKSDITVTINSGIYLYATSTGSYGLNLSGGTTGDTLTIVNNGYIMGMGGGGGGESEPSGYNGNNAGNALNIPINATITNTSGYILGGGGGGAGVDYTGNNGRVIGGGGGGAGGGKGGRGGTYAVGGAGGGIGASGANGGSTNRITGGGGGGRVVLGTGGAGGPAGESGYGGGAGGGGAGCLASGKSGSTEAACGGGGGWGASGGRAATGFYSGGNGGSAGNAGSNPAGGSLTNTAGSGGKAVNLNGKTVTWTGGSSSSSRAYGAVS